MPTPPYNGQIIDRLDYRGGPPTPASSLEDSDGNVMNYDGVDLTGNHDNSSVFAKAAAADGPFVVPFGDFYNGEKIVFDQPKIVVFGDGRSHRTSRGELEPGSVCRIFTDQDINMFEIRSGQVFMFGGLFDLEAVVDGSKAVFYYPLVANGEVAGGEGDRNGWNGGCQGFHVIGNKAALATTGGGSKVIEFDAAGSSVDFAYWYGMKFSGDCRRVFRAFEASAKNPATSGQSMNTFELDLFCQGVAQPIFNESVNKIRAYLFHQNLQIFGSQADAEAYPALHSTTEENRWHCDFIDFRKAATGGLYSNHYSYDISSAAQNDKVVGDSGFAWAADGGLTGCIPVESDWASGHGSDTSANFQSSTSQVNTLGIKREGYSRFDQDLNRPVWAVNDQIGGVWVDSAGVTVHNPPDP